MKKIFLSAAMLTVAIAFGQKKEIAAAVKAIDAGDMATTNAQIAQAESAMGNKTFMLEPALLEQYYYAKGLSLMKSGKTLEGASYLAKINDLAKNKIYAGKDASKNKVYYVGKAAADESGIQGLKEESYVPALTNKLSAAVNPVLQAANKQAFEAFEKENFELAGKKFQETYNLLKALGSDDQTLLLNAAVAYSKGGKTDDTISMYNELINSGYTGVGKTYTAKNKKSGAVESLPKTDYEIFQKMGASSEYTDFKIETSPSIEKQLYVTNANNLYAAKRYDEAIALADKGLKKFPNDDVLTNVKGLSYFNSGKSSEFIDILKLQVAKNPKDYESWFNLGIMQKNDPALAKDAKSSFEKAVEVKADYIPAYQNLAFLVMGDDAKAIDDYNASRKAGKIEAANKIMEDRRARLAAAVPYAEKWYQYDSNNIEAVGLLKGLYMSTKNEAKHQEFKAKEEAMKAAQK